MARNPQHVLRDTDGNDLAYFFIDQNGDLAIEHVDSGEQAVIGNDGLNISAIDTDEIDTGSVSTEELSTVYDVRLSSVSEIENIDSQVSQGDVVRVDQPDTPYTLSSSPHLQTSHVTLEFESPYAKDGQPILRAESGSGIQGLRVNEGAGSEIEGIEINGYGWDGQKNNVYSDGSFDSGDSKWLHGLDIGNVDGFEIKNAYITGTAPYHVHNQGGSGITVLKTASNGEIHHCEVEDPGDRCIQVAGDGVDVHHNKLHDGFDRGVSGSLQHDDGNYYGASDLQITKNRIWELEEGSAIGLAGGADGATENQTAEGNVAWGDHRALVTVADHLTGGHIADNIGRWNPSSSANNKPGIEVRDADDVTVEGNFLNAYPRGGVETGRNSTPPTGVDIKDNTIINVDTPGVDIITGTDITVVGNTVRRAQSHGVQSRTSGVTIRGNRAVECGNRGYSVVGDDCVIVDNTAKNNGQDGGADGEFTVQATGCELRGNTIQARGASNSFNEFSGSNNRYIENDAPDDGSVFTNLADGSRLLDNNPRHYDLAETISGVSGGGTSLSSSISRASLGDEIEITVVPDANPGNDLAFDSRLFWDNSSGELKVQIDETANGGGGDARVTAKLV